MKKAFAIVGVSVSVVLAATGCAGNDGAEVPSTPAAAGVAAPEVSTTPTGSAETPAPAASDVQASTEGIQTTPGAPKLTSVTVFVRPEGFPTYKAHYLGKLANLFPEIALENPTDKAVKVELRGSLQGFSEEGSVTLDLAPRESRKGGFNATLDFAKLDKVSAPIGATYSVKLLVDGKVVGAWTRPVQILPKNTVFWSKSGTTGIDVTETGISIAALTTPHDAWGQIDELLQEAASNSRFGAMIGYQYQSSSSTADQDLSGALDQVNALFVTLQGRGFNYTNVATDFSGGQNVRYPAESLRATTGNCIDGSLVFAAALEAIGMSPFVVTVPGHAFMGVHAGRKGTPGYSKVVFLETTMVNDAAFLDAVKAGATRYQTTAADRRQVFELDTLRAQKWSPAPFPM